VPTELTLLPRVSYGGKEIASPRLRSLLALLGTEVRTGCSTARLVDGIWPDERPENPGKALQILVSRARSQLGAGLIETTSTGYRLTLDEDQVDASALLLSASLSARHARAGDHAAALAHAQAGLALWDGGIDESPDVGDPVAQLRLERSGAHRSLVRARALALSRLGQWAEAIEPLTELVYDRPRDEELLLELLRCESATAGPSAALARYEAYRRALRDDLGSDPGAALQRMHQQLLQGSAPEERRGVAHEPNTLLGRDGDKEAVAKLLRTSRVASIVGPGGLGKTRLAQVVSREAEQRIVHFVGLIGAATDADVVDEVASTLGVGEALRTSAGHPGLRSDLLAAIAGELGPGPTLLVLDNCEHVVDGAAEFVRALVAMTPEVRVLTTSRAPLDLSSEAVYLLPELDLPTSVELFEQRARAARPDVDLPADIVAALCARLDGLPLAVELAAARVRVMSVADIADGLADRFTLLRGGGRDAPKRHRTLHAVVDWSWNLLEPGGRAAMEALSVFPAGFTVHAADHVLDGADTTDVLEDLVEHSLLKVADTPTGTRFAMLESVREFSAVRREASGSSARVVDGLLRWARAFGAEHHEAVFGPDPVPVMNQIRAEQDNVVLALRHGIERGDGPAVAATSAVLMGLWLVESSFSRLTASALDVDRVLSHFRPEPDHDSVDVMRTALAISLMTTLLLQGPRASRSLVGLRRLAPAAPTTTIRAIAEVLKNIPELLEPDYETLRARCASAEPLVAGAANGLATYVWERENDLEEALEAARAFLAGFDSPGTPWLRIMALSRVGELSLQAERSEDARRYFEAALHHHEDLGEHTDRVGLRGAIALAHLHLGAVDEAARWLSLAMEHQVDEDIGNVVYAIGVRAEIALARGEVENGLRQWRSAFDRFKAATSPVIGGDPSMDPWFLELQAVVVIAHAHYGRLEAVEDITDHLAGKAIAMLDKPAETSPGYIVELPICGALLLALAMIDIRRAERDADRAAARTGARLVALAERFRYVRNFQPTMSSARARAEARTADEPAYDDALSSYAGLGPRELRARALDIVRARPANLD
jgi:predicted ATPase/DNA-binding SARP family transcriptional activator